MGKLGKVTRVFRLKGRGGSKSTEEERKVRKGKQRKGIRELDLEGREGM